MPALESYSGDEAIAFLQSIFIKMDAEKTVETVFYDKTGNSISHDDATRVRLAAFDNEYRREHGGLPELAESQGAYYKYGNTFPNHYLFFKTKGKGHTFCVDECKVDVTAYGESIVSVSSDSWDKISRIKIRFFLFVWGNEALDIFKNEFNEKMQEGLLTTHIGKWSTTKSFDRKLERIEAELAAIGKSLASPNPDALKTMSMSEELLGFEVKLNDPGSAADHTILPETKEKASALHFSALCILFNVPGRELNMEKYMSSYVFLLGTPFSNPMNLLICRKNLKDDTWPDIPLQ